MGNPVLDRLEALTELDSALAAYLDSDRYCNDDAPRKALALRALFLRLGFSKCLAHYDFEPFRIFDKDYDQDAKCQREGCGHPYYRHFDWGAGYSPHCKYCACGTFSPVPVPVEPERDPSSASDP